MTPEIILVLTILGVSVVLLVTEWIPMEVTALLVLGAVALTGLTTPVEALSGFSNPAVVTVWAVFILSAGLQRTGVANIIGRQILRMAGRSEARIITVIMLSAGLMSAFMNNVAVAALLLPVTMDIARKTGTPPSRLLMPLAFGSLLGGLTTMIGTPPNILVSSALREAGLPHFRLFDFTPVGLAVMAAGVAFTATIGRRLLPMRDVARESEADRPDLRARYKLQDRTFVMRVRPDSALAGRTLAQSRLGSMLGLYVVEIIRKGRTVLSPGPAETLQADDRLVVMSPIILSTAADMGLSPHALMMALALAASSSFTSPIAHPANLMVMGPGGYRFTDYLKLGVPLTLVVLIVIVLCLPLFWPLSH